MLQIAAPLGGAVVEAAGAGAFALLGALGPPPPTASPPASVASTAPMVSDMSSLRSHSVRLSAGSVGPRWKSLVSIETAIDSQHAELVKDEQQITLATNQLGAAQTPTTDALRPSTPGVLKSALQQLATTRQFSARTTTACCASTPSTWRPRSHPQCTSELTSVAGYAPPDATPASTWLHPWTPRCARRPRATSRSPRRASMPRAT